MTAIDSEHERWLTWQTAGQVAAVDAALRQAYDDLAAGIEAHSPTCWVSGRCCHFDQYGHRLYVTGLEIAWMLSRLKPAQRPTIEQIDLKGPCVFQVNQLCSVHAWRPLGCRIFYCQQGTQDWQQDLYEQFLTDLRKLHDQHDLPYHYMEWRGGLQEAIGCLYPSGNEPRP